MVSNVQGQEGSEEDAAPLGRGARSAGTAKTNPPAVPATAQQQQQRQRQQQQSPEQQHGEGRKRKGSEPASPGSHAAAQAQPAWLQPQQPQPPHQQQGQEEQQVAAMQQAQAPPDDTAATGLAAAGVSTQQPPAAVPGREQATGGNGSAEELFASVLPSVGPLLQVPEGLLEAEGECVVGALRSGLPPQESWALNALALLSFQTTLLLPSLPGLADALVHLVRRGFESLGPPPDLASKPPVLPAASTWHARREHEALQPALRAAASAGAALAHQESLARWRTVLPDHAQLEHRAAVGTAAAQVLYNAAAAAPEVNAGPLLAPGALGCYLGVLRAARRMHEPAPGGAAAASVRAGCRQPFLTEAAVSVLALLERLAQHVRLEPPGAAAAAAAGSSEGGPPRGPLSDLLLAVVALVAPGRPLLPLPLCTAALDTLTAWAASGSVNAAAVQGCCTVDNPQLLRNVAELLACSFDDIRLQGEERVVEEGGFPELGELAGVEGEDAAGLREVCVDMAAVITQVRLLASATQLLLRVVSSRAVEVRRSVAVHTRLIKLLAGVAAHDHPGYPLSWQINPARAAHLTAIKDRMLPLFEHRSIVLKQARMHATTILASLAFDPATRQYVLPYEAQILQQVMCGRVPSDGPMNALLAAFTSH